MTNQNDTFWLTVIGEFQYILIVASMITFLIIPRQGQKEYIFLGLVLLSTFISESISEILWYVFKQSGNIPVAIHFPFIVAFYVLLYKQRIHWVRKNFAAYALIAMFFTFAIINLFFIQGISDYNSYSATLQAGVLMGLSVTYFYVLIQQLPTQSITRLPMFWINAAVLVYYSGTFFIYLSADYLVNVLKDNLILSWFFHHFLGLVYYSMLVYAMLLVRAECLKSADSATANG